MDSSLGEGATAHGKHMTPSDFVKLHDYIDNCELFLLRPNSIRLINSIGLGLLHHCSYILQVYTEESTKTLLSRAYVRLTMIALKGDRCTVTMLPTRIRTVVQY